MDPPPVLSFTSAECQERSPRSDGAPTSATASPTSPSCAPTSFASVLVAPGLKSAEDTAGNVLARNCVFCGGDIAFTVQEDINATVKERMEGLQEIILARVEERLEAHRRTLQSHDGKGPTEQATVAAEKAAVVATRVSGECAKLAGHLQELWQGGIGSAQTEEFKAKLSDLEEVFKIKLQDSVQDCQHLIQLERKNIMGHVKVMVQEDLDSLRSRLDSLTSADMASVKTLKESMQGMQLKMDAVWTQMHKLMVDNGESNSSGSAFIANPRLPIFPGVSVDSHLKVQLDAAEAMIQELAIKDDARGSQIEELKGMVDAQQQSSPNLLEELQVIVVSHVRIAAEQITPKMQAFKVQLQTAESMIKELAEKADVQGGQLSELRQTVDSRQERTTPSFDEDLPLSVAGGGNVQLDSLISKLDTSKCIEDLLPSLHYLVALLQRRDTIPVSTGAVVAPTRRSLTPTRRQAAVSVEVPVPQSCPTPIMPEPRQSCRSTTPITPPAAGPAAAGPPRRVSLQPVQVMKSSDAVRHLVTPPAVAQPSRTGSPLPCSGNGGVSPPRGYRTPVMSRATVPTTYSGESGYRSPGISMPSTHPALAHLMQQSSPAWNNRGRSIGAPSGNSAVAGGVAVPGWAVLPP